jgi:DNA invertase Pin-like site-specific DNA recombinase
MRVAIWLRVSTDEQKIDSQSDAVERYVEARGWQVTARFVEHGVSGGAQNRKVVEEILDGARRRRYGAIVVFRGDRAFRTAGKGCLFIDELLSCGCSFVSIDDGIDTGTAMGEVMAKMITVLAEWERRAIRARCKAGIDAARARGKKLGRPRRPIDLAKARALISQGQSVSAAARVLDTPEATLRRALARQVPTTTWATT